jgi:hypothetical protein
MPQTVSVGELTDLVVRVFLRHGVSGENAGPVAETVVAAERDGAVSHGLLRLPGYVSTLKSGWVDGRAVPVVTDAAPGLVATEAANGFAQPALRASAPLLREKARRQGIAAVAIRNSHHFAAVWPDIEPFAAEGFIALAMVNGRQRMVVWGGKRKLLGTSPMAFACPRPGTLPLVWDQASSVMAQGEILLAARVSGTTSTYVFVPVLCCDDDAICFLRSIFDAAAGQGAAFSPIMIDGALVLPEVSVGMIDASATRRLSMPHTRNWSSTTAIGSEPILQVAIG